MAAGRFEADENDSLETARPRRCLRRSLCRTIIYVDEFYEWTIVRFNAGGRGFCDWLDRWLGAGWCSCWAYAVVGLSWVNRRL